jgi:hypothetical protein
MTIASQDFREIKNDVHTDARGRLTLGAVAKEKKYKVFVNDMGQILLDPVVSIPERELWLWQNAEALDSETWAKTISRRARPFLRLFCSVRRLRD